MSGFLATFVSLLFNILFFAILGRVLSTWIDPQGRMPFTQTLRDLTEPILAPIRSVLPSTGMFDFSPIIAMLLLQMIQRVLLQVL